MTALTSSDFDLDDLVSSVLMSTTSTAAGDIAAEVAALVPVEHLRSALTVALASHVRYINGRVGHDARQAAERQTPEAGTQVPPPPTWSRWKSASSIYMTWMSHLVSVPDVGRKRREDCSLADQKAIAAYRKSQAATLLTEAQREFMFAAAMEKHGADRLGDLPELVVLEILRWKPAT